MTATLTQSEREELYTRICKEVDAAGPAREALFLAQLSLLLMERVGSFDVVNAQIDAASDRTDRRAGMAEGVVYDPGASDRGRRD